VLVPILIPAWKVLAPLRAARRCLISAAWVDQAGYP
jgi:hypothetical protein